MKTRIVFTLLCIGTLGFQAQGASFELLYNECFTIDRLNSTTGNSEQVTVWAPIGSTFDVASQNSSITTVVFRETPYTDEIKSLSDQRNREPKTEISNNTFTDFSGLTLLETSAAVNNITLYECPRNINYKSRDTHVLLNTPTNIKVSELESYSYVPVDRLTSGILITPFKWILAPGDLTPGVSGVYVVGYEFARSYDRKHSASAVGGVGLSHLSDSSLNSDKVDNLIGVTVTAGLMFKVANLPGGLLLGFDWSDESYDYNGEMWISLGLGYGFQLQ